MKKWLLYNKIFVNLLVYIGGLLLILFVVPRLLGFFAPIVIGGIIAMIANPLVRLMERKVKIVRKHSSAIIIVLVILLVIGVMAGAVYYIVTKVSALVGDLPDMMEHLQDLIQSASMSLQKIYANLFGEKISKSQRLTNWENDVLTDKQKVYAATDAWSCIMLYEEIMRLLQSDGYVLEVVSEENMQQEASNVEDASQGERVE